MNHLLSSPKNIDRDIQELQTWLYDDLRSVWNTDKLDGYGRIYKNERAGKVIPEVYDSTKRNYKETLYNGRSCFFFIDDDNHPCDDEDHEFTTDITVVFMLNLSDLKTATERADADVKNDVVKLLAGRDYKFRMKEYVKGIDNVLRGFDQSKLNENDMHPLHVFAIRTSWSYSVI